MIIKNYSLNNISSMIMTINQAMMLYIQGNSASVIAKKLNMSCGDVYKILIDNNVKIRKGNSNDGIKVIRTKGERKKKATKEKDSDTSNLSTFSDVIESSLDESNVEEFVETV